MRETAPGDGPEPWLRFQITPEPDPDERDALIAALAVYLAARPAQGAAQDVAATSRWAAVGRREAVHALANRPRMGWGRERSGW